MNTIESIFSRRSVRKFLSRPIDTAIVEKIIEAGAAAPSSKNKQPWRFVAVVSDEKKREMVAAINSGIERETRGDGLLPNYADCLAPARHTVRVMAEAPLTLFVLNAENRFALTLSAEEKFSEMANIQSIGAAIENMILAALEYGLGSLWICDIYFAYGELEEWLGADSQIIAAVSFGYPNERPAATPRKPVRLVTEWK